jgi:hypothetical protein
MPIGLPVWVKTVAGRAWPKLKQWGVDRFIRAGVSRTAMDGEDFANEGSLPYLVKLELEGLASDILALPQIRSEPFRTWLRLPSNLDLFVSVLVAKAGNRNDVAGNAQDGSESETRSRHGIYRKPARFPLGGRIEKLHPGR